MYLLFTYSLDHLIKEEIIILAATVTRAGITIKEEIIIEATTIIIIIVIKAAIITGITTEVIKEAITIGTTTEIKEAEIGTIIEAVIIIMAVIAIKINKKITRTYFTQVIQKIIEHF